MATNLFSGQSAESEIQSHRMFMKGHIDEAKSLEALEQARARAIEAGTIERPTIDTQSATFSLTDKGQHVQVRCTMRFTGSNAMFGIKPRGVSPQVYGEAGGFDRRDQLLLEKTFKAPVTDEEVKASFRTLLADIEGSFDAIGIEVKQHNDTIRDQADRLIETRRAELAGFDALRDGLSGGL